MLIKILIDMNLSPDWVRVLARHGYEAAHWSTVGDPTSEDAIIMAWAHAHSHVVFTHDLDFGMILALTHASGPSVIQVRARDVLPNHLEHIVVQALQQHQSALASGALVTVDESRSRTRVLPLT